MLFQWCPRLMSLFTKSVIPCSFAKASCVIFTITQLACTASCVFFRKYQPNTQNTSISKTTIFRLIDHHHNSCICNRGFKHFICNIATTEFLKFCEAPKFLLSFIILQNFQTLPCLWRQTARTYGFYSILTNSVVKIASQRTP